MLPEADGPNMKNTGDRIVLKNDPGGPKAPSRTMATMMMETINNMLIEMYASFAHAEMEKRAKRQKEGIEAKKARGEWDNYGRPRVVDSQEFAKYYKRVLQGKLKPVEVMNLMNINKSAYYRYRKEYEENSNE